jgi:hypothetical protein
MSYTVIMHTHSDYHYLWKVIEDYIKCFTFKKILLYNELVSQSPLPSGFDEYIKYDASDPYTYRYISVLEKIQEEYIFLINDVDIIININEQSLSNYISILKNNQIDRLSCVLFNGNGQIKLNNTCVCNLNLPLKSKSNHFTPCDCSPSIWNKKSLLSFFTTFPNKSYSSLELHDDVIQYCKTKLKCYGIQVTEHITPRFNRGLTYCDDMLFLHITVKGKFLTPFSVYADLEPQLVYILNKYNINTKTIGETIAHRGCYCNNSLI